MKADEKNKIIFSVAGGKGGVGKSIFSVALATVLAKDGNRVALVDLDLGAANVHTYLGIIKKTPTIADFILKKVSSLEDVLIDTSQENLKAISGAEFVPGMANPAHWIKLKIMRHVRALPADLVIIDLGAGVHFNTLDFFGMSDRGIVVTAPEPGAVMNAYGFIKGALFRKLQNIFRKHPDIGPIIDGETKKTGSDSNFTLDSLTGHIKTVAPDMLPLIQEVEKDFSPALVVNRIPEMQTHVLVKNLISLCRDLLGDRILPWAVPWLDAVERRHGDRTDEAAEAKMMLLELGDSMRPAPALSGSEGLVVPGYDGYGPLDPDEPSYTFLLSLWSGSLLTKKDLAAARHCHVDRRLVEPTWLNDLDTTAALSNHYDRAALRWESVAVAHAGTAQLWLDLASRARNTARLLSA